MRVTPFGKKVRQAVMGALNRNEHSPIPNASSIDWKWTIGRNLKNYQPQLGRIVPERVYFYSRAQRSNNWTVIVDMDQSGSMAESVVYGAVTGSIFASLPALDTRVVAFDTEVVDLTEKCGDDPVDMLFGVQLGGGTDINKSVAYCQQFITDPARTLFFLNVLTGSIGTKGGTSLNHWNKFKPKPMSDPPAFDAWNANTRLAVRISSMRPASKAAIPSLRRRICAGVSALAVVPSSARPRPSPARWTTPSTPETAKTLCWVITA